MLKRDFLACTRTQATKSKKHFRHVQVCEASQRTITKSSDRRTRYTQSRHKVRQLPNKHQAKEGAA